MNRQLPAAFRLALPAYLVLLLVLAVMGSINQGLLHRQLDLMAQKTDLTTSVARARLGANAVTGPPAVAEWARTAGMVPVPEGGPTIMVARDTVELPPLPAPSLEVRTVWR
ncbi:MAG: hypothetical protein WC972_10015 [Trueperaceae bacterium]|jgi:hypothetical protein|nr:hypothetical protein [Truepera sp.]HRN19210.1 hypothetical protein [Trueperaceae bacterium]